MQITTIGIDLAKNVFQVHGVDEHGKTMLKKQLKRDQMAPFFANLPPCLVGMEACGSAHYWARKLQGFGHTVKLMAPQFVKPYVKTNKNEMDVSRPHRRKRSRQQQEGSGGSRNGGPSRANGVKCA
jgi:transposase